MGCHFLLQCMKGKSEREVAQSHPTLRLQSMGSLPGSSIHGIFQARVLEWGAIAFSRKFPRKFYIAYIGHMGLPWWLSWQRICLQCKRPGFNPCVKKIPWKREWLPTLVYLTGESHGQRNLWGVGCYSPWGSKESDMTEVTENKQSFGMFETGDFIST